VGPGGPEEGGAAEEGRRRRSEEVAHVREKTAAGQFPSAALALLQASPSLELIESGELFFAHLPTLSDGLEGRLTERTRDRLFQYLLGVYGGNTKPAAASLQDYEDGRDKFFVNCWHMNDYESYLMWKVYGDAKGIAVQTTVERMQISFERFPGVVRGSAVDYIDFSREAIEIGNAFTAINKKDVPYRDEREFRLLFWQPDKKNQGVTVGPKGVKVQVDLESLIQAIYLSPQHYELPSKLLALLEAKGLDCTVHSSGIRYRST
jgi:hypothetical protein